MLDIEIAGSIAPGAKIVVYFAENTDAGFLNAITTAVHDQTNTPSIVSISWGGPESSWTHQAMTSLMKPSNPLPHSASRFVPPLATTVRPTAYRMA
jgi:subtilase family serine protease